MNTIKVTGIDLAKSVFQVCVWKSDETVVSNRKNDANDALAICETALRPGIHFVAIKTIEQQDIKALSKRASVDGRAVYCSGKPSLVTDSRTRD